MTPNSPQLFAIKRQPLFSPPKEENDHSPTPVKRRRTSESLRNPAGQSFLSNIQSLEDGLLSDKPNLGNKPTALCSSPSTPVKEQPSTPQKSQASTPTAKTPPTNENKPRNEHDPQFKRVEIQNSLALMSLKHLGTGSISKVYLNENSNVVLKIPFDGGTRIPDEIAEPKAIYGKNGKEETVFDAIQIFAKELANEINGENSKKSIKVNLHIPKSELRTITGMEGRSGDWQRHETNQRLLPSKKMLCITSKFCSGDSFTSEDELNNSKRFSDPEKKTIKQTLKQVQSKLNARLQEAKNKNQGWIPMLDWKPDNIKIEKTGDGKIKIHLVDPGGDSTDFAEKNRIGFNEQEKLADGPGSILANNNGLWDTFFQKK